MMDLAQEQGDKGLRLASLTAQCIVRATGTGSMTWNGLGQGTSADLEIVLGG